jgi:three-Cys-motif partner protein
MAQQAFGGPHTAKKLERLEKYLRAFLTAFQNQSWAHTIYLDAFAGTGQVPMKKREGELPLGDDDQAFIMGSAKRALGLELKFNEYIFVEKSRKKSDELRAKLQSEYPDRAAQIVVHAADANTVIRELCACRDWRRCRAVVFLDPFGSQVDWKTIEAIASTRAIDLWYLFPAGLSVHRQIFVQRRGALYS